MVPQKIQTNHQSQNKTETWENLKHSASLKITANEDMIYLCPYVKLQMQKVIVLYQKNAWNFCSVWLGRNTGFN